MRLLAPFRALRPPPELAPSIASPPYDVVSSSEARALAAGNPRSFFRISRPEVALPPEVDEHSDPVHARGRAALEEFRRNGWLLLDDAPRFSLYRQRMGNHTQTGLVACASVDAYVRGDIKRHELTRPDKEDDRTRHIEALGANDEPVFLAYRARPSVDAVLQRGAERAPDVHFTSDDGVEHTVWVLPPSENAAIEAALATLDTLYIADGHHRSAAAARVQALQSGAWRGRGRGGLVPRGRLLARGAPDPSVQPPGEGSRARRERGAAAGARRALRGDAGRAPRARRPAHLRAVPRRTLVAARGPARGGARRRARSARRLHPPGRRARPAARHPGSAARPAHRVRGRHPRRGRAPGAGGPGRGAGGVHPLAHLDAGAAGRSATPGRSCPRSRPGSSRSCAAGSSCTRSRGERAHASRAPRARRSVSAEARCPAGSALQSTPGSRAKDGRLGLARRGGRCAGTIRWVRGMRRRHSAARWRCWSSPGSSSSPRWRSCSRSGRDGSTPAAATYVGSERCESCHPKETAAWRPSNHARAMQVATEKTVLGDFNGATLEHRGKTWRFFRKADRFVVSAEGPDGAMHDYEVAYTFGVAPLQQYLVPFPGGRLQALSAGWDVRQKRWFHVDPHGPAAPTDWLHWSRAAQNWNGMCADCHSTNVQKGYDPDSDSYRTTWSEVSVGCEACHGPSSLHLAWAEKPEGKRPKVENAALVTRTSRLTGQELADCCATCHARRAQFIDQGVAGGELLDRYLPVLLRHQRLPPRRANPRRGLRVAGLQPEQDVRVRCPLHRLPRRALGQAARGGERALHPLPPGGCVRRALAPLPQGRVGRKAERRGPLRLVSHAGAELHGGPLPARPLDPGPPAGPHRQPGRAQRLQRLPHGQAALLGPGALRPLVRQDAQAERRNEPSPRAGRARRVRSRPC